MTEPALESAPFFTVIIPVYNRAQLVLRAIKSVLDDPSTDVEVIVVDDASSDNTAECIAGVVDPRVRLLRLEENGGCCVARNAGAKAARGQWLVFLDSDDELAPSSLDAIRRRAVSAPSDVGKLLFACRDDSGAISPIPAFDGDFMDYHGYLRWIESTIDGLSEALPTTRRSAFLKCPYPETRGWLESTHELDFARSNQVQRCPEVVRFYHFDAQNRLMVPSFDAAVAGARARVDQAEAIIAAHGQEMQTYAPRRWIGLAREAALYNFFAGDRSGGIRNSFAVLRLTPLNLRMWVVLVSGAVAPSLLVRVWTSRRARFTSRPSSTWFRSMKSGGADSRKISAVDSFDSDV